MLSLFRIREISMLLLIKILFKAINKKKKYLPLINTIPNALKKNEFKIKIVTGISTHKIIMTWLMHLITIFQI